MSKKKILTDDSRDYNLADPQIEVLEHLFVNEHNLIVSAGAGTGKTTTMVEAVTEAVLRENNKENNPFNKVLVVTFTIEAARQLKKKVRERVIQHSKCVSLPNLEALKRQIENESWILTLDSFTRKVLNEEMIDAGIGSIDEATDDYELSHIRDNILREIKDDPLFEDDVNTLQDWAPKTWLNRDDRDHWERMIWDVIRSGRQLGMSGKELMNEANRTLREDLFLGCDPKNLITQEKEKISTNLTGEKTLIQNDTLEKIYLKYEKILKSFKRVLLEVEEKYDNISKSEGKLTYDDVRYHIIKHMDEHDFGKEFRKNRFKYVFVDEFQDTSHAQCDLLKAFISENTKIVLIGDPRQSIYQWREADPNIFSDMVETVSCKDSVNKVIKKLGVKGFVKVDLDVNFRSNDSIVKLGNNLFGDESDKSLFKQEKFCRGIDLPSNSLETCEDRIKSETKMNGFPIHIYNSDESNAENFAIDWSDKICNILSGIGEYEVFEKIDNLGNIKFRKANLGDCWILMRSTSKWKYLKEKLNDYNIDYIFVNQKGLFQKSASIQIVIDMLNWIGNPHDFESLSRIVRSPLLGLEDKTLRYIASKKFELDWISDGNVPDFLYDRDVKELKELISLREDLRWKREGRKSELVECILQFSCFDITSLSTTEGVQELGNIRQFQQIIDGWEDEQLMSFQEFIERINYYRDIGTEEAEFNFAPLAEQEEKESVKITTVHSSKGLGFPIVFIYNPDRSIPDGISFANNDMNLIIKKKVCDSDETLVTIGFNLVDNALNGLFKQNWREINNKIDGLGTKNIFDRYTIFENWAEEWRLCYVALTRAEDHIFIPFKSEIKERYSWERILNEMNYDDLLLEGCNYEDDIETHGSRLDIVPLDLPDLSKKCLENYVPISLSISHLYDLFVCPRRYQYVQLQHVSGPSDCEGVTRPDGIIFGNALHNVMELSDFKKYEINDISVNKDIKVDVEKAMETFYQSHIYQDYKFACNDTLKEEEFSYPLNINGHEVILEGKIDCLMKTEEGLIVFDYKTANPDNKFEKEHQKFQIIGYSYLLNKLYPEVGVSKAVLLYYDRRSKTWSKEEVPIAHDTFEECLEENIPVKLDDYGLVKGKHPPCKDGKDGKHYCENVIRLCENV